MKNSLSSIAMSFVSLNSTFKFALLAGAEYTSMTL